MTGRQTAACRLVKGGVRNEQVLRVLLESGYDGPLSLETEGHQDLETCRHLIAASKRYLDRLLPELGVSLDDALPPKSGG